MLSPAILRDEVAGVSATSCDPAHGVRHVLDEESDGFWSTTGSAAGAPLFVDFRCPVQLARVELACCGVASVAVAGMLSGRSGGVAPVGEWRIMGGAERVAPARPGTSGLGQNIEITLDGGGADARGSGGGAVRQLQLTLTAHEHFCQVSRLTIFGAAARREAATATAAATSLAEGHGARDECVGGTAGGVAVKQVQLFGKARGGVRPNHKMITPNAF